MYFPALIMAVAKYISQFAFSSGYQLNFTYLFYSLSKGRSNVLFYGSNILRYYNKVMWLAMLRGHWLEHWKSCIIIIDVNTIWTRQSTNISRYSLIWIRRKKVWMTFRNSLILTFLWFQSWFTPWPIEITQVETYQK